MTERAQWGSRLGFVLSAMGCAVGFGSISRFPMNVANNGGAAFLVLYTIVMLVVGIPMLVAEFSLGRSAQKNTVGVFTHLEGDRRTPWRFAGAFFFLFAGFFLSWYSVAAGWVLRYVWASLTGAYFADPSAYLFETVEGPDALLWHFLAMVLTFVVLTTNVAKGIERLNLVLMPTLFLIIVGLAVYAATLPGGSAGYAFYLQPDFSRITVPVLAAVVGQAFFSLGVGMGAMMTYASYLPRGASLTKNATIISLSTIAFATLAGLMVFPMLASFGQLGSGAAGLDLIFGPLAQAFASMGSPVGILVGLLFFVAVFFAAFTSAVSLAEPAIAYAVEEKGVDRRRAALVVCALIYTGGVVAALSAETLALEGGALTDAGVILGGLLLALYVGWRTPVAVARARMDESDEGWKASRFVLPVVRWVMPGVLALLLLFSLLGTPCALTGGAPGAGLTDQVFGVAVLGC